MILVCRCGAKTTRQPWKSTMRKHGWVCGRCSDRMKRGIIRLTSIQILLTKLGDRSIQRSHGGNR